MSRFFIHILMLSALFVVQLHDFVPHNHHDAYELHIEDSVVIESEHHDSHLHNLKHDFSYLFVKKTNTKALIGFSKELSFYQNAFQDKNSITKFRQFSFETSLDITPIHLYRTLPLRGPPITNS